MKNYFLGLSAKIDANKISWFHETTKHEVWRLWPLSKKIAAFEKCTSHGNYILETFSNQKDFHIKSILEIEHFLNSKLPEILKIEIEKNISDLLRVPKGHVWEEAIHLLPKEELENLQILIDQKLEA